MPLARYTMYAWGTQIYVAPTWDRGQPWLSTLRHIAKEGTVYVIGCCIAMRKDDIPDHYAMKQMNGLTLATVRSSTLKGNLSQGRCVSKKKFSTQRLIHAWCKARSGCSTGGTLCEARCVPVDSAYECATDDPDGT